MDIISFNESATANSRIENFIKNPDSTSGVLTVPKTIAAGETITIPAGRVAILPDLQVDGDLVVDGDLFIPTGSMTSKVVQKVASTDNAVVRFDGVTGQVQDSSILIDDNGNLNITGVGKRITGDFSNETFGNRVIFQTSTNNSNTIVSAIPNGTATETYFSVRNNSDADNASNTSLGVTAGASVIGATKTGTGSYLPLTFVTSGTERVRIDTEGNVGIGTSSPVTNLEVVGSADSAGIISVRPNGTGNLGAVSVRNSSDTVNYSFGQIVARADKITIDSSKQGTGSYLPLMLGIGGGRTFMIDTMGNSLHLNSSGGLGYGTGSGGTVTQLTSKSTAVTLNKPTGQIIMNNAALASNTIASFQFLNSLITTSDMVIVTLNNKTDSYNVWSGTLSNGSCFIDLKNIAVGTYSESVVINFAIIKGATA